MNPAEFANISRAEEHFWWYRGMRAILYRLLDPVVAVRGFHRVLDAGCGTGHLAGALQTRYGFPVTPLDLSAEGLRHARRMGLERLVQGDLASLPFRDAAFDLVLSMDVIVHFPRGQESRAVSELIRVLEPGGLLVLRVAALDILRSRHSEFARERQRFTKARLVSLVRGLGVEPLRTTYANSVLLPIALAKFRVWEPLFAREPHSGVEPVAPWLDKLLASALEAESFWIGRGHDFPLGQSLMLVGRKTGSPPACEPGG